jgi:hypothetical protein
MTVILLFSNKTGNKSITFGAPKLYHNFGGRVKFFRITYFLCVIKKQHNSVVQCRLSREKIEVGITPQKIGY